MGGGYCYGAQGYTHHGVEDLGVLSCLPNLVVLAPGDPVEARLATRAMIAHQGPCYLRLGRAGEPMVHAEEFDFEIGRAVGVRDGDDLTFISTGGMLRTAVDAAETLAQRGVSAAVVSMHTLKPLDASAVRAAAKTTGAIISLEEHSARNGLGCAIDKLAADGDAIYEVGDQAYLRARMGDPVEAAIRLLAARNS